MDISQEEKLSIETSMGYSYNKFWDAMEEAANSKGKMNEMDVAVGLILEGVSYMKGAGMSESELIEHIKVHYNSLELDKDGNMVESVDVKAEA